MSTAGSGKRGATTERRRSYIDRQITPYIGGARPHKTAPVPPAGWAGERGGVAGRRGEGGGGRGAPPRGGDGARNGARRAVKLKLIPFNPAADLVKPRPVDKEVEVDTEEQVKSLLAAAKPHRLYALF